MGDIWVISAIFPDIWVIYGGYMGELVAVSSFLFLPTAKKNLEWKL